MTAQPESPSARTTGSCLCGKITFETIGAPISNCLCFCNSCRKHTGSIGMANSWYTKENFRILTGNDIMHTYEDRSPDSGGMIERSFCSACGSTLIAENKKLFPGAVIVPAGAMEIDPAGQSWAPSSEYFCKRKAPWFQTPSETTKYTELF
ncbi:hypothetical protein ACN47E_004486 [Coniothyrium glycines]